MLVRVLVLVAAVAPVAAAETVKPPSCGPAKQTTAKPRSVRDVDWCNFDVGAWKGPLREGHSEVHLYKDLGAPHDTIAVSLRGIVYGDVDGDNRLEAALVIEKSTWIGRTGDHSGGTSVSIYTLSKGKPVLLGSIPAGTPALAITFAKRRISVTSGAGANKTTVTYRRVKNDFEIVP